MGKLATFLFSKWAILGYLLTVISLFKKTFYNSAYQITVWRPLITTQQRTTSLLDGFAKKGGVANKPSWATPFNEKIHGWSEIYNSCPQRWIVKPRNPIDENQKKKLKDLNNCSTLYNNCHNQKKNYKKLFSEDIYATIFFSCFSIIDNCVHFKRILFLVFVQWQGTHHMVASPTFDNNWSLSPPQPSCAVYFDLYFFLLAQISYLALLTCIYYRFLEFCLSFEKCVCCAVNFRAQ